MVRKVKGQGQTLWCGRLKVKGRRYAMTGYRQRPTVDVMLGQAIQANGRRYAQSCCTGQRQTLCLGRLHRPTVDVMLRQATQANGKRYASAGYTGQRQTLCLGRLYRTVVDACDHALQILYHVLSRLQRVSQKMQPSKGKLFLMCLLYAMMMQHCGLGIGEIIIILKYKNLLDESAATNYFCGTVISVFNVYLVLLAYLMYIQCYQRI